MSDILRSEVTQTIKNIESQFNIDLLELFDQEKYTYQESIKLYRQRVIEGINNSKHFEEEELSHYVKEDDVELEPNILFQEAMHLLLQIIKILPYRIM